MIATGYPPYLFSENLCNGKLVMALLQAGIEVDVISRIDEGPSYGTDWNHGTCLNRRLILSLMNRGIESNNLRMSFIQV